ncbi:dipeptidase [Actinocatenispora comari]|uniref:Membrane dipeptidase n=1 Tax=Actinocatenispora comari TaxID=2807577 RepID=A0A8J4A5F0_9ACTN|nr:membrane dipeptidase [Actinocatenispora comari]GIL25334.1 membrane dipeptidase [Actinocatenispora comari]
MQLQLTTEQHKRAEAVHASALVTDMAWATNPAWPTPLIDGRYALERAAAGGVSAANVTVVAYGASFRDAIKEINSLRRLIADRSDVALLVQTTADLDQAKQEGKIGIIVGFQTGSPLEDDWANTLPVLQLLGLRVMQLTYNEHNLIGSGCLEPDDRGLTAYGNQVINALNEQGVIIDLAHVGMRTAADAVERSAQPVIVSHANARALFPHPRNLPDDLMRLVAEHGGVIGTTAWDVLCRRDSKERPDLGACLDNIAYVADLVGVDHVGIGTDNNENFRALPMRSDFAVQYLQDDDTSTPLGLDGFSWMDEFVNLTRGLVQRGFSDEDCAKILGGNFRRVADSVWHKEAQ